MKLTQLIVVLAALLPACSRAPSREPIAPPRAANELGARGTDPPTVTEIATSVAGSVKEDHVIGAPKTFENLTVFPISAKTQVDLGPITTLDEALKKGQAEVRETGSDGSAQPHSMQRGGSGAQVNTLVIENKGTIPIYVLAGTVVKGGKQDRQIGQDFVIDGKQVANVDAFCVEHGRWTTERDGQATGGKFGTASQLVTSSVRAAGQYKKDQSEVWAKVADVNTANKKSAASGTLMATLDDGEVAKKRDTLSAQVAGYLKTVEPAAGVVGIAYAVDGRVRGVRWFANHAIFELIRATLVNTAAVDAITATAQRAPGAPPPSSAALAPEAVTKFIAEVETAHVQEARDTAAANVNEYRETGKGYGSKTMMKPKAASPNAPPAASPAKPVEMSSDYLSK